MVFMGVTCRLWVMGKRQNVWKGLCWLLVQLTFVPVLYHVLVFVQCKVKCIEENKPVDVIS